MGARIRACARNPAHDSLTLLADDAEDGALGIDRDDHPVATRNLVEVHHDGAAARHFAALAEGTPK